MGGGLEAGLFPESGLVMTWRFNPCPGTPKDYLSTTYFGLGLGLGFRI